jgi:hypothetical protein
MNSPSEFLGEDGLWSDSFKAMIIADYEALTDEKAAKLPDPIDRCIASLIRTGQLLRHKDLRTPAINHEIQTRMNILDLGELRPGPLPEEPDGG